MLSDMTRATLWVLLPLLSVAAAKHTAKRASFPDATILAFVVQPACPFECCQFGEWTARRRVDLYSDWRKARRRRIGSVAIGQKVTAVDGVEVILRPVRMRVLADVPDIGAKPGDTLLGFAYHGEGFYDYWFRDKWIKEYEASTLPCSDPDHKRYAFCSVDDGRREWWAKIETTAGLTGWVHMFSSGVDQIAPFDGSDGCG
jgi:hypothetical protein